MKMDIQMQWALFLGALAAEWTDIERYLDVWVEELHHTGGKEKIQEFLPPSLDRELDYLSKALKCGLAADAAVPEGKRLIHEIHHLKNFRHNVIHGDTVVEKGRVICDHWRVRGASRLRMKTTYTVAQQWRNYSRTRQLAFDLWEYLFGEDVTEPNG